MDDGPMLTRPLCDNPDCERLAEKKRLPSGRIKFRKKCLLCRLARNESTKLYEDCNAAPRFRPHKKCRRCFRLDLRERTRALYERNGLIIETAKRSGCCLCPERDQDCLDFHHIHRVTKVADVSSLRKTKTTRLIEEINKCAVICANCHRKVEAAIRKGQKFSDSTILRKLWIRTLTGARCELPVN